MDPIRHARWALPTRALVALVMSTLLALATWPGTALAQATFPEATPESQGLSSEALQALAETVEDYIERDMAVGAELVVIKNRHTVLHEAFGWRDREAGVPMERDTLFNIRSMTKPITGAAAQVLIDEGHLALDDSAAEYLPGFDHDGARAISVEQLLTHRSGLPLSTLTSAYEHESLQHMAEAIGAGGPEFEPDSRFWYSDAGADVLGAIVEQASGSPLDVFVSERLLQPLGMADTYYAHDVDDPRHDRLASLYAGSVGNWNRVWGPEQEPFYPYAWGSQSLYGTPLDYARFLAMWLDQGVAGETQVLTPAAVERTLTPTAPMGSLGSDAPYPTRFPDLTAYHGQMAVLHVEGDPVEGRPPPGAEPEIIGYSGSDGTIAWAWPERDLMILYFTQSRGGATAIRLEDEIQRLLLDPPEGPAAPTPAEYADYLGTYTADFATFRNEPFEVIWRDGSLALDIPSQFIYPLDRDEAEDRWTLRDDPAVGISFVRDEAGAVAALRIEQPGGMFEVPKGEPAPDDERSVELDEVERYLGRYRETGTGREVEVLFQHGRLALRIPETPTPVELFPPEADGAWRVRLQPQVSITFSEEDGLIVGYSARGPGGEATFERISGPDASPGPGASPSPGSSS